MLKRLFLFHRKAGPPTDGPPVPLRQDLFLDSGTGPRRVFSKAEDLRLPLSPLALAGAVTEWEGRENRTH